MCTLANYMSIHDYIHTCLYMHLYIHMQVRTYLQASGRSVYLYVSARRTSQYTVHVAGKQEAVRQKPTAAKARSHPTTPKLSIVHCLYEGTAYHKRFRTHVGLTGQRPPNTIGDYERPPRSYSMSNAHNKWVQPCNNVGHQPIQETLNPTP